MRKRLASPMTVLFRWAPSQAARDPNLACLRIRSRGIQVGLAALHRFDLSTLSRHSHMNAAAQPWDANSKMTARRLPIQNSTSLYGVAAEDHRSDGTAVRALSVSPVQMASIIGLIGTGPAAVIS